METTVSNPNIPIISQTTTPVVLWKDAPEKDRYDFIVDRIDNELYDVEQQGEKLHKQFKFSYSVEWLGAIVGFAGCLMPGTQIIGLPILAWFTPQLIQTIAANSRNGRGLQFYPGVTIDAAKVATAEGRKVLAVTGEQLIKPVSGFDYLDLEDKIILQTLTYFRRDLAKALTNTETKEDAIELLEQFIDRFVVLLSRPDEYGRIPGHDQNYLFDKYGLDGASVALKQLMAAPESKQKEEQEETPNTETVETGETGETLETLETVDVVSESVAVVETEETGETELFEKPTELETPRSIVNPGIGEQKRYAAFILAMLQTQRFQKLNPEAALAPLAYTVILGNPGTGKGFLAAYMLMAAKKFENAEVWVLDCKSAMCEAGYFAGVDRHYLFDVNSAYDQTQTITAFMNVIREFSKRVNNRKNGRESYARPLLIYFADISLMATLLLGYPEFYREYTLFTTETITQARSQNVGGLVDAQTPILKHMGIEYRAIANIAKFIVCVTGETAPETNSTLKLIGFDQRVLKTIASGSRGWIIRDIEQNTRFVPSPVLKPIPDRPWGANVIDCRVPVDHTETQADSKLNVFDLVIEEEEEAEEAQPMLDYETAFVNKITRELGLTVPKDETLKDIRYDPIRGPYAQAVVERLDDFPTEWVSVNQLHNDCAKLWPSGKKSRADMRDALTALANDGILDMRIVKGHKQFRSPTHEQKES